MFHYYLTVHYSREFKGHCVSKTYWDQYKIIRSTFIYIFYKFFNNKYFVFSEPGSAPRNVQVRPLSSSTMVIQWDEPETPNGQVTVRKLHFQFPCLFKCCLYINYIYLFLFPSRVFLLRA